MKVLDTDDLTRAAGFMRLNARLMDRRRFALHFAGGSAATVLTALRPYENPDGGYGHALEPDLRGEESQPVPAQHALQILHEAGADGDPAVDRVADYLTSITADGGGVPFVLPAVRDTLAAAARSDHHGTLDFAPEPGGYGHRLFDRETIDAALDALVDAQDDDGGWDIGFPAWTPITRPEWRGHITVEHLRTLRSYGRLC